MSTFFLGTCRVYEPARHLRGQGQSMVATLHRIYTATQILQFIKALQGEPIFNRQNVHLLSEGAFNRSMKGGAERDVANIAKGGARLARAKSVVIEICSDRDFYATIDGKRFSLNSFSQKALHRHRIAVDQAIGRGEFVPVRAPDVIQERSSPDAMATTMWEIKQRLDRPILWVGHIEINDPAPRFDPIRLRRNPLNRLVRETAHRLGDEYYDPAYAVDKIGRTVALAKDGEDTTHYSDSGIAEAATAIAERVRRLRKNAARIAQHVEHASLNSVDA